VAPGASSRPAPPRSHRRWWPPGVIAMPGSGHLTGCSSRCSPRS